METNVTAPVQPTATVNPAAARLNSAENAKAASKFLRTMLVLLIIVAVVVGVIIFTMGNKAEDPTVTQPTPTPVPSTPETEMTMEEYEAVVADVKSGTMDFTATNKAEFDGGSNTMKLSYDSDSGILFGEITENNWTISNTANPAYIGRKYELRADGKTYRSVNGQFVEGDFLTPDGKFPDFSFKATANEILQSDFVGFVDYKTAKEAMIGDEALYVQTMTKADADAFIATAEADGSLIRTVGQHDFTIVQMNAVKANCEGISIEECFNKTTDYTVRHRIWYFSGDSLVAYSFVGGEGASLTSYSYEE